MQKRFNIQKTFYCPALHVQRFVLKTEKMQLKRF